MKTKEKELQKMKEEGRKKIKFYDRILTTFFVLLLIWVLSLPNFWSESPNKSMAIVTILLTIVILVLLWIFVLGMVYHAFKREEYAWGLLNLFISILSLHYYSKLRKEFEEGNIKYKWKTLNSKLEILEKHNFELR